MINPVNFRIQNASAMRKFVTSLDKAGAILPVVLLEATVTGGRTYQAYQRDGFVEARERVTEESLGAIFWLFGAKMFGSLFDKLGQKFLNIPKKMPDVGRDIVRTPFDNYIDRARKLLNITPEQASKLKSNLANYSVGKTAASIIMACLFIGYVVPKLNQGITRYLFGKMNQADPNHEKAPDPYKSKLTLKDARTLFNAKDVSINAVENFKATQDKDGINPVTGLRKDLPSFKGGADTALRIVQNFEENDVWKLMGTDVGTVTGRTANARNKDERIEILFRDVSSIYFYCFSMPAIVSFMNKKDSFGGLNTKLNPMSAMDVHNKLIDLMENSGEKVVDSKSKEVKDIKMSLDKFKEMTMGKDLNQELYDKVFEPRPEPQTKKYLFGLIKKKQELEPRIIKLDDFNKIIDSNVDESKAREIKQIAKKMSELMQPAKYFADEKVRANILTETQVKDILQGGYMRKPEVMSEFLNNIFKEKGSPKPLSNPHKYISLSKIEDRRQRLLGYVEAIIKDAEKSGEVSAKRMLELNKRNMRKNGIFMGIAMGVSALFLSTIIPKVQYYITFLRTGKNSFPGTENLQQK